MKGAIHNIPGAGNGAAAGVEGHVHAVLEIVRAHTGVDFACYRTPMLERRISNRVASVGAASVADYLRVLRGSAEEPFRLLERLTIKVSRFYRHAPTFDHLAYVMLPELAKARGGEPLRIWCAGCGAGEEAYTFAMLLEHLRIDGFVEATDIDATALEDARAAVYPLSAAVELPASLIEAYLEPEVVRGQPGYRVQDNLRERVRFTRHDVTAPVAPPGNHCFDLVSCRNVLIYLQRAAQANAMRRLLDVIREDGVLCLGEAEWPLPELASELEPLPHKTRLFRMRAAAPFADDNELNRARLRPGA